jgi:hypothetical protein
MKLLIKIANMKNILSTFILMLFIVHSTAAQKSKKQDDSQALLDPISLCKVRYYYFPNLEAYFDTQKSIYYYKESGEWITGEEIPDGYRGYSLYNGVYVFVTDYDDELITQFAEKHKKKHPYTKRGNLQLSRITSE